MTCTMTLLAEDAGTENMMNDLELLEGLIRHLQCGYTIHVGNPPYKVSSEHMISIQGMECPVVIYRHDKEADHYDT